MIAILRERQYREAQHVPVKETNVVVPHPQTDGVLTRREE